MLYFLSRFRIQMHLFLRPLSWLRLSFILLLLLLSQQPLFLVLESPSFVLFLPNVSLDTKHKQNLLSQLIIQFNIFFSRDNLVRDIHALHHFYQSFVNFSWQIQWFAEVLLPGVDKLASTHCLIAVHFLQLEYFFWSLVKFKSTFEVDLFSFFFFDKLNNRRSTIYSLRISASSIFYLSLSTLFLIKYFYSSYLRLDSYFLSKT